MRFLFCRGVPVFVAALCFPDALADDSLDKVVTDWQADLFKRVSDVSDTPKEAKERFEKVQGRLLDVWHKAEKPDNMGNAKAALDHLSKDFVGGATTLAEGIKEQSPLAISKGVLDMASSIFTSIGEFAGPEISVIGAVLGFVSAIMDFFMSIFGGESSHGTTGITDIIRRVVAYELQENHVSNLQEEYASIYDEIRRIHLSFDELVPKDLDHAVSMLDDDNLKAVITQLTEFMGKLKFQMEDRLSKYSPHDLPALFNMYFESSMHFSLIQQRAVGFMMRSVNGTSDIDQLTSKYSVYVTNVQNQRLDALDFLQKHDMDEFSDTLFVTEPGKPVTKFRLELLQGDEKNYYFGWTPSDSGYPYAALREERYKSNLEIQWEDDSKWMTKSYVDEGEYFSIINHNTNADISKVVFYCGSGWYCKYESHEQAGDTGGKAQKEDKALFTFTRAGAERPGPIKDRDLVTIKNKKYGDIVVCGGDDGEDEPMKYKNAFPYTSDSEAYYIRQAHPKDCRLDAWWVHAINDRDDTTNVTKVTALWKAWSESLRSPAQSKPVTAALASQAVRTVVV
eukprot:TRINITY_DN92251_c0_g1_i1.p1 TRINITY_DN92251_c0_g1~~TRINITY_DN92251_c0_g1_i1.p1  ORF type:complete len:566 (-),score=121.40 TRINITY_DN92251_c0_g1_i1:304-2001(-)